MTTRRKTLPHATDDLDIRNLKRLALEAKRIGAAAQNSRLRDLQLAALVAELSEVHRALLQARDGVARDISAATDSSDAALTYARTTQIVRKIGKRA